MESRKKFHQRLTKHLQSFDQATLLYNENEFWMIQQAYEYIEFFAFEHRLLNTSIALPLVRGLHNGTYRKFGIVKDGESYRLPYFIHCLSVCKMLVDIPCFLPQDEQDVLLAAALCHDLIEDIPFKDGGKELYTVYGLDKRVYDTVKLVSKVKNATHDDEVAYFDAIEKDRLAILVKLADRGNNVEDLYNMSIKKFREYLAETEEYFLPMSDHGVEYFPDLAPTILILKDKILALTGVSKIMINQYEARNKQARDERDRLKLENIKLREEWKQLWEKRLNDE